MLDASIYAPHGLDAIDLSQGQRRCVRGDRAAPFEAARLDDKGSQSH
jgi:hypothetical protein